MPPTIDFKRLFNLHLVVARHGELNQPVDLLGP
jgi:hypothetical protein